MTTSSVSKHPNMAGLRQRSSSQRGFSSSNTSLDAGKQHLSSRLIEVEEGEAPQHQKQLLTTDAPSSRHWLNFKTLFLGSITVTALAFLLLSKFQYGHFGSTQPVHINSSYLVSRKNDTLEPKSVLIDIESQSYKALVAANTSTFDSDLGIVPVSNYRLSISAVADNRARRKTSFKDFVKGAAKTVEGVVTFNPDKIKEGWDRTGDSILQGVTLGACSGIGKGCSFDNMGEYWKDVGCDGDLPGLLLGDFGSIAAGAVQEEYCPDEVEQKIKKIYGDSIPKLETGLKKANEGIAQNGRAISKNSLAINKNSQSIARNTRAIAGLDNRVSVNSRAISSLNNRVDVNSAAIVGLRNDVGRNRRDINILQGDVARNRQDIVNLYGGVNRNRQDIIGLQGDIARHDRELANVRGDIRSLRAEDERIKADIRGIKSEISTINNEIDELRQGIDVLAENDRKLRIQQIQQQQEIKLIKEELLRQRQVDEAMQSDIMRLKQADMELLENDRRLMEAIKENKKMFIRGLQVMESKLEQAKVELVAYTDEKFVQSVQSHLLSLQTLASKFTLPKDHNFEDLFVEATTGEKQAANLGMVGVPLLIVYAQIKLYAVVNLIEISLVGGTDATVMDECYAQSIRLLASIEDTEGYLDDKVGFLILSDNPSKDYGAEELALSMTFKEYFDFRAKLDSIKQVVFSQMDKQNLAYLRRVNSSPNWFNANAVVNGILVGSQAPAVSLARNLEAFGSVTNAIFPSRDTYYSSVDRSVNHGREKHILVSSDSAKNVGLLSFKIGFQISQQEIILRLFVLEKSNGPIDLRVKKISSVNRWDEKNHVSDDFDLDDYYADSTISVSDTNSWVDVNVTSIVEYEEYAFTLAFEIIPPTDTTNSWIKFSSRENVKTSPKLVIMKQSNLSSKGNAITTNSTLFCDEVASDQVSLKPIADTFVKSGSFSHDNFGSSYRLEVKGGSNQNDNSSVEQKAVIRFDLSGVDVEGGTAILRLFIEKVDSSTARTVIVSSLYDDWKENDLTFKTLPSVKRPGPAVIIASNDELSWIDIDITSLIDSSSRTLTVGLDILEDDVNSKVEFSSREASPHAPELLIHYCQSSLVIDLGQEEAIEVVVLDNDYDIGIPGNIVWVEVQDSDRNLLTKRRIQKNTGGLSYLYFRDGVTEYLKSKSPATVGKYVVIKSTGSFILNQIFVFGADRAQFRKARQSSTEASFEASNAVDNSLLSLAMTKAQPNPWWEIDLQYLHQIGSIYFEAFGCTVSSPCDFIVTFSDFSGNIARSDVYTDNGEGPIHELFPDDLYARVIRIQLDSDEPKKLTLNAFKVYGPLDSSVMKGRSIKNWYSDNFDKLQYGLELKLLKFEHLCLTATEDAPQVMNCVGLPIQQWEFNPLLSSPATSQAPTQSLELSQAPSNAPGQIGEPVSGHLSGIMKVLKDTGNGCLAKMSTSDYRLTLKPCNGADPLQQFEYSTQSGQLYYINSDSEEFITTCVGIEDALIGSLVLVPCDSRSERQLWNYANKYDKLVDTLPPSKTLVPGQFIESSDWNIPHSSTETHVVSSKDPPQNTVTFDDGDGMSSNRFIKEIHILSGHWVDGIGVKYLDGSQHFPTNTGGSLHKIKLDANEFVIKIQTTFAVSNDNYIGSLTFFTTKGEKYGPFGHFDPSTLETHEAPENHMLSGFRGSYGSVTSGDGPYVVSVGFYWAPITKHYFGIDFVGDLSLWRDTYGEEQGIVKVWSAARDGINSQEKIPNNLKNAIQTTGGDLKFVNHDRALTWSKFSSNISEIGCFTVHFTTAKTPSWSGSKSTFNIKGYGEVPPSCHYELGAECGITICGEEYLEITANGGDAWMFTITGDVGSLIDFSTVGQGEHIDPFPTAMDNNEYDHWQKYELRKDCFNVHFQTAEIDHAESKDSFVINGYGTVPQSCHHEQGAACTIQICGRNTLEITANGNDAWFFTMRGDVGLLLDYTTVPSGQHYGPYPTRIDTNEYDSFQRYELRKDCYYLHFKTSDVYTYHASNGSFDITGYGQVPSSCHSEVGAECAITLCGRKTLDIIAHGSDGWDFTITGDIGSLLGYTTAPNGRHYGDPFPTWMDAGDGDSFQRYSLVRRDVGHYSSSGRRRLEGNDDNDFLSLEDDTANQLLSLVSASHAGTRQRSALQNNDCYDVHFQTVGDGAGETSQGPFYVDGYGKLPTKCHSSSTSQCSIKICDRKSLVIRARTTDGWQFTIRGEIGEIVYWKTVDSGKHISPFPTFMDTDQFDSIQIYELKHNFETYEIQFITDLSSSPGPFYIYSREMGEWCYKAWQSRCTFSVQNTNDELHIKAGTYDSWGFTIKGDIGNLISYKTVTGGQHIPPFPTRMDTDEYDYEQIYRLQKCYELQFITDSSWSPSTSTGPFTIDGYGTVPSSCHQSLSSQCEIKICGRNTLVIRAQTADAWAFTINGDIDSLVQVETATGSSAVRSSTFPTKIDTDEYDIIQVYELQKAKDTPSPTDSPTKKPTASPTDSPTKKPTTSPTDSPTETPSQVPSISAQPSVSSIPSLSPSSAPSIEDAELRITQQGQLDLFGNTNFVSLTYSDSAALYSFLELERKPGLVLAIAGPHVGTPVTLEEKISDAENQKWKLTIESYLENEWNGLVLQVKGGSQYTSSELEMSTKNGKDEQKWIMNSEGILENKSSGKVISYSSSGHVVLSKKEDSSDKWSFVVDNCGCLECSETELDRKVPDAESKSCRHLISYKMKTMSEVEACSAISQEYPDICGLKCDPSKCFA